MDYCVRLSAAITKLRNYLENYSMYCVRQSFQFSFKTFNDSQKLSLATSYKNTKRGNLTTEILFTILNPAAAHKKLFRQLVAIPLESNENHEPTESI